MKKTLIAAALMAALSPSFAKDYMRPYYGAMGSVLLTDDARESDAGYGAQVFGGFPISSKVSVEPNGFAHYLPREVDDKADLQLGAGVDFNFHKTEAAFTPFFLLGGGFTYEDVAHVEEVGGYANAGVGFMYKLSQFINLRGDLRGVLGFNEVSTPSGNQTFDGRASLGFTYGFTGQDTLEPAVAPPPPAPVDSDGDGVPDPVDQCPGTPPGTAVDASGCPATAADTDGDGVPDPVDQCPGTPPGTAVDPNGCALPAGNPDEDGDGVANEADKCPNTPAGFKVDEAGCLVEQTLALQSVNFEFGSDTLTADAKKILDGIAAGLKLQTAAKVAVTGHTDSLGPQSYNLSLSQRRAKAVVTYLVAQGVGTERLVSDGEGEFAPIASNDNDDGRAKNRRVEFKVVTK